MMVIQLNQPASAQYTMSATSDLSEGEKPNGEMIFSGTFAVVRFA
jgi:hypothetical protein